MGTHPHIALILDSARQYRDRQLDIEGLQQNLSAVISALEGDVPREIHAVVQNAGAWVDSIRFTISYWRLSPAVALTSLADVATGVGEAAWDTGAGLCTMVRHPIRTAEGVGHAVTHPVQTATAMWDHGKTTATACASGDGGACGRGAFELGAMALGGAGTVGKASRRIPEDSVSGAREHGGASAGDTADKRVRPAWTVTQARM